jgi:hypothetical protein
MRDSKAKVPKTDRKADLQRLWETLREEPPGKIVGVRSKVAKDSRRKNT